MFDLHFGKAVKVVEQHVPEGSMDAAQKAVLEAAEQFHSDTLKQNWATEQLVRTVKLPRNIASLLVELAVFLLNRQIDLEEPPKPT